MPSLPYLCRLDKFNRSLLEECARSAYSHLVTIHDSHQLLPVEAAQHLSTLLYLENFPPPLPTERAREILEALATPVESSFSTIQITNRSIVTVLLEHFFGSRAFGFTKSTTESGSWQFAQPAADNQAIKSLFPINSAESGADSVVGVNAVLLRSSGKHQVTKDPTSGTSQPATVRTVSVG